MAPQFYKKGGRLPAHFHPYLCGRKATEWLIFMKEFIKRHKEFIKRHFISLIPLKNTIVFESAPDYSDNTRAVFDEMISRGLNKKYKLIWWIHDPNAVQVIPRIENVECISCEDRFTYYRIRCQAKMLIACNGFFSKLNNKQYSLFLAHGAALKNCSQHYNVPSDVDHILCFSDYLAPSDAHNLGAPVEKMLPLGYPRNDRLMGTGIDVHTLFPDVEFKKVIYWMPTYRQHRNGMKQHSSISMPILYNEEIAQKINACALREKVLVIAKPHPAQDVSLIKMMKLSNLQFIDDAFLAKQDTLNYDLLASADALLTDYSSVYYDYLLTDRPIGLCWDDFESYKENEGFTVDTDVVMAGGEKIYTADDLCGFISRIASGEDRLKQERTAVKKMIHQRYDGKSTERVVDYIESVLKQL